MAAPAAFRQSYKISPVLRIVFLPLVAIAPILGWSIWIIIQYGWWPSSLRRRRRQVPRDNIRQAGGQRRAETAQSRWLAGGASDGPRRRGRTKSCNPERRA